MKRARTVTYSQVSTLRMVAGQERRIKMVVHDGMLKEWVGIGWVDVRRATADDRRRYPRVV